MTQTPQDKGQFVQFPVHMIYGRQDLTRDDKWVLIAIMGTYWTEGPHKLSYREIKALSGVPTTLLASYTDKKTKKVHEGIINKLERLGDIRTFKDKERNAVTGLPKGQEQTYIVINYARFWQQNVEYCDSRKSVSNTNTSVSYTNTSVPNTTASVSNRNDSVSVLPSEMIPIYITDITDITDIADRSTDASAIAPAAPTSSQQAQEMEEIRSATTAPKANVPAQEDVPPDENGSHSHKSGSVTQAKPGREKSTRTAKAKVVELVPTAEEQVILDMWQSIFKRRIPINEALIKAAGRLVPCEPTLQDLKDCRGFCYTSNGEWYKKKGVQLSDIVGNWAKWQTTLELPPAEEAPLPQSRYPSGKPVSNDDTEYIRTTYTPGGSFKDEFYPSEAEKRAAYAEAN